MVAFGKCPVQYKPGFKQGETLSCFRDAHGHAAEPLSNDPKEEP